MCRGITLAASIAEDFESIRQLVGLRFSRYTTRTWFEFRGPNPKLYSGCNIWQILWLIIVWPWELSKGSFCELLCLVESFPIGPETFRNNKKKVTCLVYLKRPDFSLRRWNYKLGSKFNGIPRRLAKQITTLFFFFLISATEKFVVTSHVEVNYTS